MNHSKCCYFNALLYLTSPFLTESEDATLPNSNNNNNT